MQDIDVHGRFEKLVVTLLVMRAFSNFLGALRACAYFRDPTAVSRIIEELDTARMDAPLIIAVNGVAAGTGFGLSVAGDLMVASDSAFFTMACKRAGPSSNGSSSYYLPGLIGLGKTRELRLTHRTLPANEALQWGLINYMLPGSAVMEKANDVAAFVGKRQPRLK